MKKLITMFAIGALAAGSAFADKEGGERKEGEKPKGERPARPEGERPKGERPARPEGEKPKGERPARPEGEKPKGERPARPEGERGRHGPGEMIKMLDKDESGTVSFEEFKASPRAEGKEEEKVKVFFDKMDKDGDGSISAADLAAIRKEMEEHRKAHGGGGDKPKRPEGGDRPERPKRPEGEKKKDA